MINFDFDPKFPPPCNKNWTLKSDTDPIRNELARLGYGTEIIYKEFEYFLKVSTKQKSQIVNILLEGKKYRTELKINEIIEILTT